MGGNTAQQRRCKVFAEPGVPEPGTLLQRPQTEEGSDEGMPGNAQQLVLGELQ